MKPYKQEREFSEEDGKSESENSEIISNSGNSSLIFPKKEENNYENHKFSDNPWNQNKNTRTFTLNNNPLSLSQLFIQSSADNNKKNNSGRKFNSPGNFFFNFDNEKFINKINECENQDFEGKNLNENPEETVFKQSEQDYSKLFNIKATTPPPGLKKMSN